MPFRIRLAILVLPFALGATATGAQEAETQPSPSRAQAPPPRMPAPSAAQDGRREFRPRESLMQMQRRAEPDPDRRAEPPAPQDHRSMSDAVRRVQRSTGGQIIGAERVPYEGRDITRVKYMDERGRVRYMDDPGAEERRPPRRPDNGQP